MPLVRNLSTGYLSPAYHTVHDDLFETVYAPDTQTPEQRKRWADMCTFQRWEVELDPADPPPPLEDHWLTEAEKVQNRIRRHLQSVRQGRKLIQEMATKDTREDSHYQPPPREVPSVLPRELPQNFHTPPKFPPSSDPHALQRSPPIFGAPSHNIAPAPPAQTREDHPVQTREPPQPVSSSPVVRRNPSRKVKHQAPEEWKLVMDPHKKTYDHSKKSYVSKSRMTPVSSVFRKVPFFSMLAVFACQANSLSPISAHLLHQQSMSIDPLTHCQEHFHPGMLQSPLALKAKASKDPDLPSLQESLTGPYAEQFWAAMDAEIASLESKGTWQVVERSSMPPGAKAVPGTWAQRIKRLPNGSLSKFKSRWC